MSKISNYFTTVDPNKGESVKVPKVTGVLELRAYAYDLKSTVEVSELIETFSFESDEFGVAENDVSKILESPVLIKFVKFYQANGLMVGLEMFIKSNKLSIELGGKEVILSPIVIRYLFEDKYVKFRFEERGLNMERITNPQTIELQQVGQINYTDLRVNYITKQREYELVKREYEEAFKSTDDIVLVKKESYYPENFKFVVTRLLELQRGTLEPAIEFTSDTKLEFQENILREINRLVNRLSELYPDVIVDDGEGQPYSVK